MGTKKQKTSEPVKKKESKKHSEHKEPVRSFNDRAREISSQGFNIIDESGLVRHYGE